LIQLRNFLEQKGFYRITLKRLKSGHYTFKAKVNNISGVFILDTGASNSCIGFIYDSYFNLNNEESEIKAAGAGALNMETALAKNNLLVIGDWKLKKMDFILMNLSHVNEALKEANELPVHGIIGADFLKQTRAVIDYGKNCFYII
jgi:hypothetical protein